MASSADCCGAPVSSSGSLHDFRGVVDEAGGLVVCGLAGLPGSLGSLKRFLDFVRYRCEVNALLHGARVCCTDR